MMFPKPKSAPARMRESKFVKNKTNAMKEIEAWVKKDDDPFSSHEASRMSGQLTDNVTEERMLRSKLWELSKERYKFLAQNAYEKKMFTDRISRKSSAFLRRASSSSNVADRQHETGGSSRAKQRWKNARLSLLDRLDPTKKRQNKEGGKQAKEKAGRRMSGHRQMPTASGGLGSRRVTPGAACSAAHTPAATGITVAPALPVPVLSPTAAGVPSYPGAGEVFGGVRPKEDSPFRTSRNLPPSSPFSDTRNVKFKPVTDPVSLGLSTTSKGPLPRTQINISPTQVGSAQSRRLGPRSVSSPIFNWPRSGVSSKPSSATSKRTAMTSSSAQEGAAADALRESWMQRKNRHAMYGMRLDSMTKDPRYAQLEKSLAPLGENHAHKPLPDVTSVVNNFDALHIPPRKRKDVKPKTELKALEYMREQGFAL